LHDAPTVTDERFGFAVLEKWLGVPANVMVPRAAWADGAAYDEKADFLAGLFKKNFVKFAKEASQEIVAAGPA
jgi:phosphoenolpyruvate carboxykinase (ATP)